MKGPKLLLAFLALRIASVFIVQTLFVPDEYWQSLEVAHKLAFNYGYLTWEWTKGIRSYLYPLVIAALYKGLAFFQLDTVELLVIAPRLLQATLTAVADYRFCSWCKYSKWSVFMIMTSWFWFYTGSRTLINTFESSITVIALSYYPWKTESTTFIWLVAIVSFIRPTAVVPWIPLCLSHIWRSKFTIWELLLKRYLVIGLLIGSISVAIDSYAHGSFLLSPLEFLKFNVINEVGSFYGSNPWYWYFTTGLPIILGLSTIPLLLAIIETIRKPKLFPERIILISSILLTLIVYSLLPHKEFRFILPLLPMCLHMCSDYLSRWSRTSRSYVVWFVAIVLLVTNVVPAVYFSCVHRKGTNDVMPVLAKLSKDYTDENGQKAKFLFLMPCHSTPFYSHIHQNITMRFLTCEPNFNKDYSHIDQSDRFYRNPAAWIRSNIPVYPKTAMPTHLILFDKLVNKIPDLLNNFDVIHEIPNKGYVSDRVGKSVLVYQRRASDEKQEEHL